MKLYAECELNRSSVLSVVCVLLTLMSLMRTPEVRVTSFKRWITDPFDCLKTLQ